MNVIEDWALLEQALKTVTVDLVLVDVAERARLESIVVTSPCASGRAVRRLSERGAAVKALCKLKATTGRCATSRKSKAR